MSPFWVSWPRRGGSSGVAGAPASILDLFGDLIRVNVSGALAAPGLSLSRSAPATLLRARLIQEVAYTADAVAGFTRDLVDTHAAVVGDADRISNRRR